MPARNTSVRFGSVAQFLHWAVLALLVFQVALGLIADELPAGFEKLVIMSRHKSLGITIVIGVAAVIAMLAVGRGAQESITGSISGIGTNLLFVFRGDQGDNIRNPKPLTLGDAEAIRDQFAAPLRWRRSRLHSREMALSLSEAKRPPRRSLASPPIISKCGTWKSLKVR